MCIVRRFLPKYASNTTGCVNFITLITTKLQSLNPKEYINGNSISFNNKTIVIPI